MTRLSDEQLDEIEVQYMEIHAQLTVPGAGNSYEVARLLTFAHEFYQLLRSERERTKQLEVQCVQIRGALAMAVGFLDGKMGAYYPHPDDFIHRSLEPAERADEEGK